jgi:hypothetical protein
VLQDHLTDQAGELDDVSLSFLTCGFFALLASTILTQNWENKECRQAIYDEAIRFWLDRGIDGFRIDTVV